jgi:hypothetical protein
VAKRLRSMELKQIEKMKTYLIALFIVVVLTSSSSSKNMISGPN